MVGHSDGEGARAEHGGLISHGKASEFCSECVRSPGRGHTNREVPFRKLTVAAVGEIDCRGPQIETESS